jgi:hypothetical protein
MQPPRLSHHLETKMRKLALITAGLMATTALPALAAGTAVGLIGDRTLVMISTENAEVTGMQAVQIEGRLLGIDYRSPNGTLIGVTEDFAVVAIDPETGATTPVVQMDTPLPITNGAAVVVDINPAADALRFMSGTVNHRVNLTTGAVMVDGDLHFADDAGVSDAPMIVATGYINNLGQPESTAMYNLDAGLMGVTRQAPPNDGTNTPVGMLGVSPEGPLAFDVGTAEDGTNTAWLAAGLALHRVDLETGAVTESWDIAGLDQPLRDLTLMP